MITLTTTVSNPKAASFEESSVNRMERTCCILKAHFCLRLPFDREGADFASRRKNGNVSRCSPLYVEEAS